MTYKARDTARICDNVSHKFILFSRGLQIFVKKFVSKDGQNEGNINNQYLLVF